NECYLYYSFMQTESDPRLKGIWELHLNMELEHLRIACDLMRRHDGRDPEAMLPHELPEPVTFEPNKEYIREVLATQIDYTTLGTGIVQEAHERFEAMQERINAERPSTETVIEEHRHKFGDEYRLEVEGPHPVPRLRAQPYGQRAAADRPGASCRAGPGRPAPRRAAVPSASSRGPWGRRPAARRRSSTPPRRRRAGRST